MACRARCVSITRSWPRYRRLAADKITLDARGSARVPGIAPNCEPFARLPRCQEPHLGELHDHAPDPAAAPSAPCTRSTQPARASLTAQPGPGRDQPSRQGRLCRDRHHRSGGPGGRHLVGPKRIERRGAQAPARRRRAPGRKALGRLQAAARTDRRPVQVAPRRPAARSWCAASRAGSGISTPPDDSSLARDIA